MCNSGLIWVKKLFPKRPFQAQKKPFTRVLRNSCFEKFCKIHRKASLMEIFRVNFTIYFRTDFLCNTSKKGYFFVNTFNV